MLVYPRRETTIGDPVRWLTRNVLLTVLSIGVNLSCKRAAHIVLNVVSLLSNRTILLADVENVSVHVRFADNFNVLVLRSLCNRLCTVATLLVSVACNKLLRRPSCSVARLISVVMPSAAPVVLIVLWQLWKAGQINVVEALSRPTGLGGLLCRSIGVVSTL